MILGQGFGFLGLCKAYPDQVLEKLIIINRKFSCRHNFYILIKLMVTVSMQIVNWRAHLKFPEEAKLSAEAKDLICKLLCNVEQRLGTKGAYEIKVSMHMHNFLPLCFLVLRFMYLS